MAQEQMMNPEQAGRGTDTVMAHMSLGEIVIPRAMQDDPEFLTMLQNMFQQYGADINEFTVGHEANKINPETGYPEFFGFRRLFRRVAPFIAPALAIAAPGVGTALGSALLGAGAAGASTLGSGLIGAGLGGLSGGLKGALTGGALGALSPNISDIIGTLPGGELQGPTQTGAPLSGVSTGSGLAGVLGRTTGLSSGDLPGLGTLVGGGSTGGGSSFGQTLATTLGGLGQEEALKKQQQQLLAANAAQQANLANLNPTNVQNDPGYQFAQQQGEQALNRTLGAQGNLFSGRALRAAADLNQGLASKFYNDAYARQAGLVGAQNALTGAGGQVRADTTGGRASNLASTLSRLAGGNQYSLEDLIRMGLA